MTLRKREKADNRDKRLTCVCVCARAKRVYVKALSKYQFETATTIGMRHAFHRPLRPAFHFYLYLPGASPSPPPLVAFQCPRVTPRYVIEKGCRETVRSLHILRHFVSNPRPGTRRGITWHLGPYSTFMGLNRDEVSREWTNLATPFPILFLLSLFLFYFV